MHPTLITLPIGFWVADIGFWWPRVDGWATAAMWLLGAAILGAALAAIAGLIDFMGDERIRTLGDAWQHAIGNVIARPACCPTGLVLSSIVVGIVLFTAWKGGEMVFRHRVAVYAEPKRKANPVRCQSRVCALFRHGRP
jgi:uncharacterized membrane protein